MCVRLIIFWNCIKMHGHQNIKKNPQEALIRFVSRVHTIRVQMQITDLKNREFYITWQLCVLYFTW